MVVRRADIGHVVSSGTEDTLDLIRAFATELNTLLNRQSRRFPRRFKKSLIQRAVTAPLRGEAEQKRMLADLIGELKVFAPDGCTFGALPGSIYGFWTLEDM